MIGRVALVDWVRPKVQKRCPNSRLMSPGTGKIKSPIVHSPFVPALQPMGGRPPTSTTLKTSTSSCTRPARALEFAAETFDSRSTSRGAGEEVVYVPIGV